MIKIRVEYETSHKWFRADCENLAGSPPVGLGCTIEAAICGLLSHPDIRDELIEKAKRP